MNKICGIPTTKFYIKIQKTIFNEKFPIICEEFNLNEENKINKNFINLSKIKEEGKLKTTIFVKTKVCVNE